MPVLVPSPTRTVSRFGPVPPVPSSFTVTTPSGRVLTVSPATASTPSRKIESLSGSRKSPSSAYVASPRGPSTIVDGRRWAGASFTESGITVTATSASDRPPRPSSAV
nr:hypothetical protein [Propionibacterium sp.]